VIVAGPGALPAAREELDAELERIDLACSRFRADADLARVNRACGRPVAVGPLLLEALDVALDVARLTGGAVVPTVGAAMCAIGYDRDFAAGLRAPSARPVPAAPVTAVEIDRRDGRVSLADGVQLDLGATAKALAADRAAHAAAARTGTGVLVNLGGDVAMAGEPPDGGWRVRVTDDHGAGAEAPGQTVLLQGGGLATSSTTVRRWEGAHHIVDPATGESCAVVWRTVSVAARSCVAANAASTASVVRGASAPAWLAGLGLPARLVAPGGEITRVAGWPAEAGQA
jgi:thiamine biosynthesis lipoprotein